MTYLLYQKIKYHLVVYRSNVGVLPMYSKWLKAGALNDLLARDHRVIIIANCDIKTKTKERER